MLCIAWHSEVLESKAYRQTPFVPLSRYLRTDPFSSTQLTQLQVALCLEGYESLARALFALGCIESVLDGSAKVHSERPSFPWTPFSNFTTNPILSSGRPTD